MTYEKTRHGAYQVGGIIDDYVIVGNYFNCTKRQAIAQFKREVKANFNNRKAA
jgi:hypothetical protein